MNKQKYIFFCKYYKSYAYFILLSLAVHNFSIQMNLFLFFSFLFFFFLNNIAFPSYELLIKNNNFFPNMIGIFLHTYNE
ncbi:hypothetical protein PFFVO_02363 [Plasmodium falciparum Vietnam Oak-Knoll (FVO)]|uniref:Uncharacterized protein n=1 Tax=Plasmodium falciparum Vietnam Oak-Knoll (FVO) TaxID=1036723 RepID=A0A024V610_PLAFA|nr:hypothetical protein PFFVO_02363 [Plasmodium falciparum Vietnam Oak-Knoll (FVO)]